MISKTFTNTSNIMAESLYYGGTYCYFAAHKNGSNDQYELFIVVPFESGKSVSFTPSGTTLALNNNKATVTVQLSTQAGAAAGYATKRYTITQKVNLAVAEIEIVSKETGRLDWELTQYFKDSDNIGLLSNILISDQTVRNCPYVFAFGYYDLEDDHFPRMLISKIGYDYDADTDLERPTDIGTNEHIRTVQLNLNSSDSTPVWLSPTYLNNAAHKYNDGDPDGYYIGAVQYSDKDKKKGKVKNTKHPVQPNKF